MHHQIDRPSAAPVAVKVIEFCTLDTHLPARRPIYRSAGIAIVRIPLIPQVSHEGIEVDIPQSVGLRPPLREAFFELVTPPLQGHGFGRFRYQVRMPGQIISGRFPRIRTIITGGRLVYVGVIILDVHVLSFCSRDTPQQTKLFHNGMITVLEPAQGVPLTGPLPGVE